MRLHLEDGPLVMFGQWAMLILGFLIVAFILRWIFAEDGKHPLKEKIVKFLYAKHKIPTKIKISFFALIGLLILIDIIFFW
jgi:uncharacterized integral membrane protein